MIKRFLYLYFVYMTVAVSGMIFIAIVFFFYTGFATGNITLTSVVAGMIAGLLTLFVAHILPDRFRWAKNKTNKPTSLGAIGDSDYQFKKQLAEEQWSVETPEAIQELVQNETDAESLSIAKQVVEKWKEDQRKKQEDELSNKTG